MEKAINYIFFSLVVIALIYLCFFKNNDNSKLVQELDSLHKIQLQTELQLQRDSLKADEYLSEILKLNDEISLLKQQKEKKIVIYKNSSESAKDSIFINLYKNKFK